MLKQSRHFAIKEIIATKQISNQDELRLELKKRGFRITQATLSRDLKELGVGRVAGETAHYILQPQTSETQILRPLVGAQILSIAANESVIVVKTLPGSASVVGEFIDTLNSPDIIGTLAGDNTLMIIPRVHRKTPSVIKFLRDKLVEEKE